MIYHTDPAKTDKVPQRQPKPTDLRNTPRSPRANVCNWLTSSRHPNSILTSCKHICNTCVLTMPRCCKYIFLKNTSIIASTCLLNCKQCLLQVRMLCPFAPQSLHLKLHSKLEITRMSYVTLSVMIKVPVSILFKQCYCIIQTQVP